MSKHQFELNDNSIFDNGYQNFVNSRLATRLHDKFRDKPFFEKWSFITKQANAVSLILNTFSVFTGFTFLFFGLLFLMGISTTFKDINTPTLISLAVASGLISIALLTLAESLKRGTAKKFFQEWLQYRRVSFVVVGILLFSGTSIFFSYNGADRFVHEIRSSPTLIDIDSIRAYYNAEIVVTDSLIQDNFKKNSWKGKLSRKARPTNNTLHAEKARLATLRDETIKQSNIDNSGTLLAFNQETENVASSFALVQIGIELSLLLCLFWIEYYDYRSVAEFAEIRNKFPSSPTPAVYTPVLYPHNSLLEQGKQPKQTQPKKTIIHNGKHYTESQVNNFIRIYEKRATNPKSDQQTRMSNQITFDYWLSKKQEFHQINGEEVLN